MTTDITRPVIFIPTKGFFGRTHLIDGWHRIWKAARLGIPSVPMHLLSQAEADSIFLLELRPDRGLCWRVE